MLGITHCHVCRQVLRLDRLAGAMVCQNAACVQYVSP
jgi:hypothetical protein